MHSSQHFLAGLSVKVPFSPAVCPSVIAGHMTCVSLQLVSLHIAAKAAGVVNVALFGAGTCICVN